MQTEDNTGIADLNAEAVKIALATQCHLLDTGFRFEEAAAVAMAVMPSIRHMLAGEIAAESVAVVVPGIGGLVKIFATDHEARQFGSVLQGIKVPHIGVNLAHARRLSAVYEKEPAHERAIAIN